MKHIMILITIIFIVFSGCQEDKNISIQEVEKVPTLTKEEILQQISKIDDELNSIGSVSHLESYIQDIIKNGSTGLGYPGGDMDAGIAAPQDAQDIARYVITLTGQKSSDDAKANKAVIFYTSNCGGCHGNDGKGINGNFPNLTTPPYKGILRLKEYLLDEKRNLEKSI